MISLPRLYAILDTSCFRDFPALLEAAEELAGAGVRLLQYRDKPGAAAVMLRQARGLKRVAGGRAKLIMNDRADLALAAEFDGVHLGQNDLSPEGARKIIGSGRWIGLSTHNPPQVRDADKSSADYVAIGPVFATASKLNPDPAVGLQGVRIARGLTQKPLVAIGGITRENCGAVIEAGADCVAVISDLTRDARKSAEEFLRILG